MPALALRLLVLAALLALDPAQAADVVVDAVREGGALHVEASAEIDADLLQAWRVLTDYDHLSAFVPGMQVSRVVARDGNSLVLEQKGEARLLFLTYPIEVKLAVTEFPHERIVAHAIGGDFREMVGTYSLGVAGNRVILRYRGRLVPDFLVPPLIGPLVLRRNVERQFSALVDEIARRQRAARENRTP